MSQLNIGHSNKSENTGRTDTGLWSEIKISSPDFNTGTTFTIFSSEGKSPLLNDLLQIFIYLFIMGGFNSSHPAELYLKLSMIF